MKKNFLKSLAVGVAALSLATSCSVLKDWGMCSSKKCTSKKCEKNKCDSKKSCNSKKSCSSKK